MRKNRSTELYHLCNKEQYFTCGSVEQYDKMFDLVRQGATARDVANIIWICSEDKTWSTIYNNILSLWRVTFNWN